MRHSVFLDTAQADHGGEQWRQTGGEKKIERTSLYTEHRLANHCDSRRTIALRRNNVAPGARIRERPGVARVLGSCPRGVNT